MSLNLWSWVLSASGLLTVLLAGRHPKEAWLWGMAAQGLWMVYGLLSEQYGFLLTAAIFLTVYFRNYRVERMRGKEAK